MQNKPERLQKILSANGITSRRDAERMIQNGRVYLNDTLATLGQSAVLGVDKITVDGKEITAVEKRIYLMLNKPQGYITTVKDHRGRKTVMELVSDTDERVFPVGRLDLDSEGILLFTNDGAFANKIMHPSNEIKKTYEVTVLGNVKQAALLMQKPLEIDDAVVLADKVKVIEETKQGGVLDITIKEGKNRQIRKMCRACGLKVQALKRILIEDLSLGGLKSGCWRYLTKNEVLSLGKGHIAHN